MPVDPGPRAAWLRTSIETPHHAFSLHALELVKAWHADPCSPLLWLALTVVFLHVVPDSCLLGDKTQHEMCKMALNAFMMHLSTFDGPSEWKCMGVSLQQAGSSAAAKAHYKRLLTLVVGKVRAGVICRSLKKDSQPVLIVYEHCSTGEIRHVQCCVPAQHMTFEGGCNMHVNLFLVFHLDSWYLLEC